MNDYYAVILSLAITTVIVGGVALFTLNKPDPCAELFDNPVNGRPLTKPGCYR